jgi:hypothetical protein
VGSRRFPVVIRPPARDIKAHADVKFEAGRVTCTARIGSDYGVLTAAHVVGGRLRHGRFTIAQHDQVACSTAGSSPGCTHRVLAVDPIMDAVLIEADVAPDDYGVVESWDEPGYNTIIIESPAGQVTSRIVEIPQKGLIQVGAAPGDSPANAAFVYCIEPGAPGWSGSMVFGKKARVPYGMFLGASNDYTSKKGRVELLRQIELVWGAEILERRTE